MVTFLNPERKSASRKRSKFFELKDNFVKLLSSKLQSDLGESDITFVVEGSQYHGHRRIFSAFSRILNVTLNLENERSTMHKFNSSGTSHVSHIPPIVVDVEFAVQSFEAVFHFIYSGELSVPDTLVPSMYILAKRLEIEALLVPLSDHLAGHIPTGHIGDMCGVLRFTSLVSPFPHNLPNDVRSSEHRLTNAVYCYIRENADTIALSSTGQLGARLIVNLTGECVMDDDVNTTASDDSRTVLAILLWAQEQVMSGHRLARAGSEENVQSDDEESDGSGSNSITFGPQAKQTAKPIRLDTSNGFSSRDSVSTVEHSLSDFSHEANKHPLISIGGCKSHLPTQDIRITLDRTELSPFISSTLSQKIAETSDTLQCTEVVPSSQIPLCSSEAEAETETCVLAPTSLGVGTTSIWLGKLAGHLISLSIKTCHPSSTVSTPGSCSSRVHKFFAQRDGHVSSSDHSSRESLENFDCASCEQQSQAAVVQQATGVEDDDFIRTVTAESASGLARAVASASLTSPEFSPSHLVHVAMKPDGTGGFGRMLEGRAGSGSGLLSIGGKDCIIVGGGFARKGCLDSVELYIQHDSSHPSSEPRFLSPLRGPRLSKQRGRVAFAHSSLNSNVNSDTLFACGGSTGSNDLNSVEKLSSDALSAWLSISDEHSDSRSLRSSAVQCTSEFCVWQPVAMMRQARSSPAAVGLMRLNTGSVVSDTSGSVVVVGGLADAVALTTAEVYIPERNEWAMLPNMCEGRSEASCSLLPTKNLVVVAGGNSVPLRRMEYDLLVEGLDLRCPNWMLLPSFNPGGLGKLRGAALVPSPFRETDLLMLGGYNGQDTLDSAWVFDAVAWKWTYGFSLSTPRVNASGICLSDRSMVAIFGGFNGGFLDSIELISSNHDLNFV